VLAAAARAPPDICPPRWAPSLLDAGRRSKRRERPAAPGGGAGAELCQAFGGCREPVDGLTSAGTALER